MQQDMFDVEKGHVGVDFFSSSSASNVRLLEFTHVAIAIERCYGESREQSYYFRCIAASCFVCVCLAPGGANKSATN